MLCQDCLNEDNEPTKQLVFVMIGVPQEPGLDRDKTVYANCKVEVQRVQ